MRADKRSLRFVRALLGGEAAKRDGEVYAIVQQGEVVSLAAAAVGPLISSGVLAGDGRSCRATRDALPWVKRAMLANDAFSGQHRIEATARDGVRRNLAESPLARLAVGSGGEPPFLEPHQVEAGERVRRLTERAQIQPRVTMNYSAAHTAGKGGAEAADITDMAAEARRGLAEIHAALPRDCAGVVFDVCGLLKGLQLVETERGWPRRSAKLVLRIGLEQLAAHYGLAPEAVGMRSGRRYLWLGEDALPTVVG